MIFRSFKNLSIAVTLWVGLGNVALADGVTGVGTDLLMLGSGYLSAGIRASPPPALSDGGRSGARPLPGPGVLAFAPGGDGGSAQAVEQVGTDLFRSALKRHDKSVRRELTNIVRRHKNASAFKDPARATVWRVEDHEVIGSGDGLYRVRVSYLIIDPVRLLPFEDTFIMKLGAEGRPQVLEILLHNGAARSKAAL